MVVEPSEQRAFRQTAARKERAAGATERRGPSLRLLQQARRTEASNRIDHRRGLPLEEPTAHCITQRRAANIDQLHGSPQNRLDAVFALGECDEAHRLGTSYQAGTGRSMNQRCHANGTKVIGGNAVQRPGTA